MQLLGDHTIQQFNGQKQANFQKDTPSLPIGSLKKNPAQVPHVCHGHNWGECKRGLLPSTMEVVVIPYKIFENLHTKSCTMDAFHDYFPGHASFGC
jgi:hypothetical protein